MFCKLLFKRKIYRKCFEETQKMTNSQIRKLIVDHKANKKPHKIYSQILCERFDNDKTAEERDAVDVYEENFFKMVDLKFRHIEL